MPRLCIEVPHALTQDEAQRRLQNRFAAAEAQYRDRIDEFRDDWTNHTFSFSVKAMGVGASGTIAVAPARVAVDVNLPWAAMLFKRTIEERLRQELGRLLAGDASPGAGNGHP